MPHVIPPNGIPLDIPPAAMHLLGWHDGQSITQPQLRDAINAKATIAGYTNTPIAPSPTPQKGASHLALFLSLLALFLSFGGLLVLRQDPIIGGALFAMAIACCGLNMSMKP